MKIKEKQSILSNFVYTGNVITIRKEGTNAMKKRIVVPVDKSSHSYKAFQFAVNLAREIDGQILLLNVQPDLRTPNVLRYVSEEKIEEYLSVEANGILDHALEHTDCTGVPVKRFIRTGVPKAEICRLAKDFDAYCIVMGSRGMGPVKSTVLGSVSLGVLQLAPCPVTIVP